MPSAFINNWINETQNNIDYWYNNFTLTPNVFSITPLPAAPVINPNILNHNLTSCCPDPNFPQISFEHFPEPYYGNPDDSIEKLTVVLFYNPGPHNFSQSILNHAANSFHDNYIINGSNYFNLSSNLNFVNNTINGFWIPKNNQLLNLFSCMDFINNNYKPLFMDLIPWHSNNFNGLNFSRFILPNTLIEFKNNVLLPAILNANNSVVSRFLNSIHNSNNKIVFFAVGAKYSNNNYLNSIGFNDITPNIPNHNNHILKGNTLVVGNNSRLRVWKINSNLLIKNNDNLEDLLHKEIILINLWTTNVGMNIPSNICPTINHIFNNI